MQKRLVVFAIAALALLTTLSVRAGLDNVVYLPITLNGDGQNIAPSQDPPTETPTPTATPEPTPEPTPPNGDELVFVEAEDRMTEYETIRVQNVTGDWLDLTGWSLWLYEYDNWEGGYPVFDFPSVDWYGGMWIHSGHGESTPTTTEQYLNLDNPIWADGTCAEIVDPYGWVRDTFCFPLPTLTNYADDWSYNDICDDYGLTTIQVQNVHTVDLAGAYVYKYQFVQKKLFTFPENSTSTEYTLFNCNGIEPNYIPDGWMYVDEIRITWGTLYLLKNDNTLYSQYSHETP